MNAANPKIVVVVGPPPLTAMFAAVLEAEGITAHTREHDKPKQVTSPLPTGCAAVVVMRSSAMGDKLKQMARRAGVPYIHDGSEPKCVRALEGLGILTPQLPTKKVRAALNVLVFGDLDADERATVRLALAGSGGKFVTHSFATPTGIKREDPHGPRSFEAVVLVTDRTDAVVKEAFRDFVRDMEDKFGPLPVAKLTMVDVSAGRTVEKLSLAVARVHEGAAPVVFPMTSRHFPEPPATTFEQDPDTGRVVKKVGGVEVPREVAAEPIVVEVPRDAEVSFAHEGRPPVDVLRKEPEEAPPVEDDEAEVARVAATPPPRGYAIGGQELYRLEDAAGALYMAESTIRKLAAEGTIAFTTINGEPYLTWEEMTKADGAVATLMDAASITTIRPERPDGLYVTAEASIYLGCSTSTVIRYVSDALLSVHSKDGRSFLFAKAALDDFRSRRIGLSNRRRRTGPLGVPNAGRGSAVPQALFAPPTIPSASSVDEARANVRQMAAAIQQHLAAAMLNEVTIRPDSVAAEKLVVTTKTERGAL